ncbi:hypothetical protein GCM10010199_61030 [Dactylosporangium roseum]
MISCALAVRQQVARSPLTLPDSMHVPGAEWETGYPEFAAKETLIPPQFHDLHEALQLVGECLNPVLSGQIKIGRWDPVQRRWSDD